ncbi:hypothetical protein POTOM_036561 [Populus tomentosa]|uniref:Helicase C-terminal domain-containing protein n=1 Tax=Populus tomentosa TaxID=118781 RepID=A0A8X7YZX6_POPTO|nr:hypothetical protein POTOM_036561 [Populus tomentosa]
MKRVDVLDFRNLEVVEELSKAELRNPVRVEVRAETKSLITQHQLKISTFQDTIRPSPEMISIHPQILHDMCLCWLLGVVLPHLTVFSDISSWEDEAGKNLKMSPTARQKALTSFTSLASGILLCTDVAAHGLDIPSADCMMKSWLNCSGEWTMKCCCFSVAKGGKAYVEFLCITRVPLEERTCADDTDDVIPQVRLMLLSYRWKELEVGKLGMGYGLFPSMPEVKHLSLSTKGFTPVDDVNLEKIKYK